jgi:hypothetical protein
MCQGAILVTDSKVQLNNHFGLKTTNSVHKFS